VYKRLAFNTASNLGTLFLKLGITFVMTPILIKNMGNYDYGLWEMVGAVIGYMGMLDLGIRPAVSRFASRFIAQKDEAALTTLYATAWYFLLAVGVFIAIILSIAGFFFADLIAPEHSSDNLRYTWFLLILAAQLLITFPSYTAESYLEAYQEYYLKNNVTIFNSILGSIIIFVFITPENALLLLAGVNAVGICSKYLFLVWLMQYRRAFLRLRRAYFSLAQLKELLRFSVKTLIQGVATKIENATDTLVIGFVMGPASVPLYSIPANLVSYIRLISYNFTHVFMPYFSALGALNDQQKIQEVYLTGSKFTVAPCLILAIGTYALGADFLGLWVGDEIANSAKSFLGVLIAFLVLPLFNPMASRYLTAIDKHGFFAKWQPIVALANLGLSVLLIYPLGILGVALGSLIPALVFQPILLIICCKNLGFSPVVYLRAALLPWLVPSIGMAITVFSTKEFFPINNYFELLIVAVGATLIFVLLGWLFALTVNERSQLVTILKRKKHQG
jgi:O-antigen/teichoic acid export membrane protein